MNTTGLRELAMLHKPAGAQQLEDAKRNTRAALAALRAIDVPSLTGETFRDVSRVAALLSDIEVEITRIEARARRGRL